MPSALRRAGAVIELHSDHFRDDAEDSEWLEKVGKRGWVVLTKDRRLRSNYLQLVAIVRSNVRAFAITAADLRGEDMGSAFVKALPQIQSFIKRFNAPFTASVSAEGHVSMTYRHHELYAQFVSGPDKGGRTRPPK